MCRGGRPISARVKKIGAHSTERSPARSRLSLAFSVLPSASTTGLPVDTAWAITEWLRGTMFTGFPWNPAAAALAPTPLITVTPLIGTYGLSGLTVLLGGAIWLEYYKKWLPVLVIVGATGLLWLLPSSPVPPDPLAVLNVRIVQPNIGQQLEV